MIPDDSSSSAKFSPTKAAKMPPSWPPTGSEVAETEAVLTLVAARIAQMEQTLSLAKTHLAALTAAAPALREALAQADADSDSPRLTDLAAARGLRSELVKVSQESVAVSQASAKYLQARERFLLARRAGATRREK